MYFPNVMLYNFFTTKTPVTKKFNFYFTEKNKMDKLFTSLKVQININILKIGCCKCYAATSKIASFLSGVMKYLVYYTHRWPKLTYVNVMDKNSRKPTHVLGIIIS